MTLDNYLRPIKRAVSAGLILTNLYMPISAELGYAADSKKTKYSKSDTSNVKLRVYRKWDGPIDRGLGYTFYDQNKFIDLRHEAAGRKTGFLGLTGLDSLILDFNVRTRVVRDTIRDTIPRKPVIIYRDGKTKIIKEPVYKPQPTPTQKTPTKRPVTEYEVPRETPQEKPPITLKQESLEEKVTPAQPDTIVTRPPHKKRNLLYCAAAVLVAGAIAYFIGKEKEEKPTTGLTGDQEDHPGIR